MCRMVRTMTRPERKRAFGSALTEAIAASGMKKADIVRAATMLGAKVSAQTLNNWAAGDNAPDVEEVWALEAVLSCPGALVGPLSFEPAPPGWQLVLQGRADREAAAKDALPPDPPRRQRASRR